MRGVEIGALYSPRVTKADGDVRYVDHYSTEELRARYQANEQTRPHLDEIVDVDYVVKGDATLSQVAGPDAPFDYVLASHVIEHVPDPVSWIADAANLLLPGGVISLVVPDKRFCFDVNRAITRPEDWVDWASSRITSAIVRADVRFLGSRNHNRRIRWTRRHCGRERRTILAFVAVMFPMQMWLPLTSVFAIVTPASISVCMLGSTPQRRSWLRWRWP